MNEVNDDGLVRMIRRVGGEEIEVLVDPMDLLVDVPPADRIWGF